MHGREVSSLTRNKRTGMYTGVRYTCVAGGMYTAADVPQAQSRVTCASSRARIWILVSTYTVGRTLALQ